METDMVRVETLNWLFLFMSVVAVEGTVEVLLKGKIFDKPRAWWYGKFSEESFIGKLSRCPYCTSFWIAAFILMLYFVSPVVWFVYVFWLCLTRLSNLLNDLGDKIFYSQYSGLPDSNVDKNEENSNN